MCSNSSAAVRLIAEIPGIDEICAFLDGSKEGGRCTIKRWAVVGSRELRDQYVCDDDYIVGHDRTRLVVGSNGYDMDTGYIPAEADSVLKPSSVGEGNYVSACQV
jgi:hypothetical protein